MGLRAAASIRKTRRKPAESSSACSFAFFFSSARASFASFVSRITTIFFPGLKSPSTGRLSAVSSGKRASSSSYITRRKNALQDGISNSSCAVPATFRLAPFPSVSIDTPPAPPVASPASPSAPTSLPGRASPLTHASNPAKAAAMNFLSSSRETTVLLRSDSLDCASAASSLSAARSYCSALVKGTPFTIHLLKSILCST